MGRSCLTDNQNLVKLVSCLSLADSSQHSVYKSVPKWHSHCISYSSGSLTGRQPEAGRSALLERPSKVLLEGIPQTINIWAVIPPRTLTVMNVMGPKETFGSLG